MGNNGFNTHNWYVILPRLLFSIGFFHLGHFFKIRLENANIYKSSYLAIAFLIQFYLLIRYQDISYTLAWAEFKGHLFVPILVSLTGIYLYLFISKLLENVFKENDLLVRLGRNSLHVLASHIFVFFIINIYFIKTYNLDKSLLSNIWFSYMLDKNWPIYISFGVLLPFAFSIMMRKISTIAIKLLKQQSMLHIKK